MIRMIDATLTKLDEYNLTKEQVSKFCKYLVQIGINDIEISKKVYYLLNEFPENIRFYLNLNRMDKSTQYPNIYKYIYHNEINEENSISEFQLNDIREIVKLRAYKNLPYIRIVGLDDLMCHNYSLIFHEMNGIFTKSKVNFSPEDGCKCASALAVLWIQSGQKEITSSFNGIGSLAATEEIIVALRVTARVKPNQNLDCLPQLKELYETITGKRIRNSKPVIGSNIFQVESGVHVDGIIKNPSNYEAYKPEIVGQKTRIIIGKHSGLMSVWKKLQDYGIFIENEELESKILFEAKQRSNTIRRSLTDEEFLVLAKEVIAYDGKKDAG